MHFVHDVLARLADRVCASVCVPEILGSGCCLAQDENTYPAGADRFCRFSVHDRNGLLSNARSGRLCLSCGVDGKCAARRDLCRTRFRSRISSPRPVRSLGLAAGAAWIASRGGYQTSGPLEKRALRYVIGLIGIMILWDGLGEVFPRGEDVDSLDSCVTSVIPWWVSG